MPFLFIRIFLLLLVSVVGTAQDPHFSQLTRVPALYNPAMSGIFEGISRVGILYQDHFNLPNATIRRGVVYGDYGKTIELQRGVEDRLGVGGGFIYDDFNVGAFSNNSLFVNVAYQKSLSYTNKHKIGLGIQLNYGNRIIDYSRLSFGTQFLEGYYDPAINTQEFLGIKTADYLDIQLGALYSLKTTSFQLRTGVSVFHVTQPTSNAIDNFRVPITLVGHLAYEMWFFNSKTFYVDVYYRYKSLQLAYYGMFARYTVADLGGLLKSLKSTHLMAGASINSSLLFSPYVGIMSNHINFGISFDIKVGSIDRILYPFESFLELFFTYTFPDQSDKQKRVSSAGL